MSTFILFALIVNAIGIPVMIYLAFTADNDSIDDVNL